MAVHNHSEIYLCKIWTISIFETKFQSKIRRNKRKMSMPKIVISVNYLSTSYVESCFSEIAQQKLWFQKLESWWIQFNEAMEISGFFVQKFTYILQDLIWCHNFLKIPFDKYEIRTRVQRGISLVSPRKIYWAKSCVCWHCSFFSSLSSSAH